MNSNDLFKQMVDKIQVRTFEQWLMQRCEHDDVLRVIKSQDSGTKMTSLQNERTDEIFVAVTTHPANDDPLE